MAEELADTRRRAPACLVVEAMGQRPGGRGCRGAWARQPDGQRGHPAPLWWLAARVETLLHGVG